MNGVPRTAREPLTATEAYALVGMIYVMRKNGKRYVTVKELSKEIGRRPERVRILLNRLKEKGYVVDIDIRNMKEGGEKEEEKEYLGPSVEVPESETLADLFSQLRKRFSTPRGGVEKGWRIVGYDVLDRRGIEEFFKDFGEELEFLLKVDAEELKAKILAIGKK